MSVIDMQDRELLELAARAWIRTGMRLECPDDDGGIYVCRDHYRNGHRWNPLTDDGDALRLAVTLGIKFRWHAVLNQALAWPCSLERLAEVAENGEDYKGDIFAAARRAITRAAAEIGRSMPC